MKPKELEIFIAFLYIFKKNIDYFDVIIHHIDQQIETKPNKAITAIEQPITALFKRVRKELNQAAEENRDSRSQILDTIEKNLQEQIKSIFDDSIKDIFSAIDDAEKQLSDFHYSLFQNSEKTIISVGNSINQSLMTSLSPENRTLSESLLNLFRMSIEKLNELIPVDLQNNDPILVDFKKKTNEILITAKNKLELSILERLDNPDNRDLPSYFIIKHIKDFALKIADQMTEQIALGHFDSAFSFINPASTYKP